MLRLQNACLLQRSPAALGAQGDVDPGQTQQHLPRRLGLPRLRSRLVEQGSAHGKLASPAAIGEQPVMTQSGEAARQHMQEEAPDAAWSRGVMCSGVSKSLNMEAPSVAVGPGVPGVCAEGAFLKLMAPSSGARAITWASGEVPTGYKSKDRHSESTGPGMWLVVAAGQGMSLTASRIDAAAKV